MKLEWKPLAKIDNEDFLKNNTHEGIYIWGFRIEGEFIPYYIGQASNVAKRILEHLLSLMSGKYTIYHKENLKDFYKSQKEYSSTSDWPNSFLDFFIRRKELSEHLNFMLDNFEFSFVEVEDKPTRNEVEKYFIQLFGVNFIANMKGGVSQIKSIENLGDMELVNILNGLT